MKRLAFIPVIAVITLAGCTTQPGYFLTVKLNDEDKALLTSTHEAGEQAKSAAEAAATAAKAAHEAADKAVADAAKAEAAAQAASAKIDRMFAADEGK